ncbi:Tn3 family transposase [Paraburkholderia sp. JPY419]|uniref:Tn3 family transposase n=1 Tax=Paraburkholderia sp. JPY419 TaxID=667660 RepID=UPI003D1C9583
MLIDRAPQQIRLTNYVGTLTNLIGAHEHESHYVFDLCYHNTTDIAPTIITGDMHSINKMNFAAMYWFEMDFAPRFTNLQAQLKHLFCGDDIEQDDNFLIKPAGQVDLPAICDDPCVFEQIIAPLSVKEMSQQALGNEKALAMLKKISPVAWRHIHFLGYCHPLKGRWKAVQHYAQGAALRCCEAVADPVRSVAAHPVFRSSGCGTDPHQSPIGFKASAGVLVFAPGSRGAPESRRYQANVHGVRQQYGYLCGHQACSGSWSGRLSRYAASGMAGGVSQSTCWFDANNAAGLVTPRQGQLKHRLRSKGLPSRIM